jgi:hypothetical protein
MAVEVMTAVWNHSKASPAAKLVLLAIADHQGERGAWPSEATLARVTGMSERSVRRKIVELVELGELSVEVNAAPAPGRYKSNLYWVLVGRVDNLGEGGQIGSQGWTDSALRVDTVDQQTVIEPLRTVISKKDKFAKNWTLSSDDRLKLEQQYPNADLDFEIEAMIDYLVANGKENEVKDMAARFRTWMRNADKFNKGSYSKRVMDEWFVKPENRIQR